MARDTENLTVSWPVRGAKAARELRATVDPHACPPVGLSSGVPALPFQSVGRKHVDCVTQFRVFRPNHLGGKKKVAPSSLSHRNASAYAKTDAALVICGCLSPLNRTRDSPPCTFHRLHAIQDQPSERRLVISS